MQREYLEEDLKLIRMYFPGAKTVNLRTPFDLASPVDPWHSRSDVYRSTEPAGQQWYGDLLWNGL